MEKMNAPPHVGEISRHVRVRADLKLRVLDHSPAQSDGPVFVLVHGLSSNALMWRGVARVLAERGFRSLSVDLRGHGQSSKPDGPYDLTTVTDDLASLLDLEGLDRPVLAGQSWGANVAVEFAARFPGRSRGVMPVDGGFIDLSEVFPVWEDCEREMAPPRLAGTPAAQIEQWLRSAHPDWSPEAIDDMMGFVEVHADGTASPRLQFDHHIKVLRGLWEHRPMDRYASISDPIWWLVAEQTDHATGWASRKREAITIAEQQLAVSRTTWMVGDHDLHAQYPDRVAALLVDGLTEGFFV
jgi:pimeloyl-ACP methyl ester carboxylesterase